MTWRTHFPFPPSFPPFQPARPRCSFGQFFRLRAALLPPSATLDGTGLRAVCHPTPTGGSKRSAPLLSEGLASADPRRRPRADSAGVMK